MLPTDTASALRERAMEAAAAGSWNIVAGLWRQFCDIQPSDGAARFEYGKALAELHLFEESERQLDAAAALDPSVSILRLLAHVQNVLRRYDSMELTVRRLIPLSPTSIDLYLALAKLIGARGDSAESLQVLAQGMVAVPHDYNLATAYVSLMYRDDDAKALAGLESIYAQVASNPKASKMLLRMITNIRGRVLRVAKGLNPEMAHSWADLCVWVDQKGLKRYVDVLRRDLSQPTFSFSSVVEFGSCAVAEMNWEVADSMYRRLHPNASGTIGDVVTLDLDML